MSIGYGTIKYKILTAMLMAGEYPYNSLDLMKESIFRKREGVYQLKEKGYIDIKVINGTKRIRFKMFEKRKRLYIEDLFEGAESYTPNIRATGERKLERIDRIAEILMTMMESGVGITPDQKPSFNENGPLCEEDKRFPYFITSQEARKIISIKEDKGKGARFHGTLVSRGGLYNVYNMGSAMMDWVRPAEKTAVSFNLEYQKKYLSWGDSYAGFFKDSAIVYAREMAYIENFINGDPNPRRKHGCKKNISQEKKININDYYDHTFYLPLNRMGQIMTNIMTKKNWHYYLVGMFFKKNMLASNETKLSIDCDAEKDGNYYLVFLDGDISRLKRFVEIGVRPEEYEHFSIICYDFQEEVVKRVAPAGMKIKAYDFTMVTNKFFEIYNMYEGTV